MTPRRRKVKGSSPKSKVKKILARWSDGLFYVIKILKVSEKKKRCLVEFEDQSTAFVQFKDLLDEHKEESKSCHNCGGGDELENNSFIRCTNCDRDFHSHCHVPPIISDPMAKQFVCRICVFAACAKAGGAIDTGPMAARFMFMKRELPYDLEHLSWNPSHTSNTSECYCYCGGPGNFFNKMLQCCRCQQWFHEACIQCISEELLMGDRFYIFACAHCNFGEEFVKRLSLNWPNIVYISVFHLILTQGVRYVDLDLDIVPFLRQHSDSFGLCDVLESPGLDTATIRKQVLSVVNSQTDIYCSGLKVKKKRTLYGIHNRVPPPPPSFYIPYQTEKISNLTLTSSFGKRTQFKPPKYLNQVPYLTRGANQFIPSTMSTKLREASMARLKSEHNYCSHDEYRSSGNSTFLDGNFDANNNSPVKKFPITIKKEVPDEICDTDLKMEMNVERKGMRVKRELNNDIEKCNGGKRNDPVQRVCPISAFPDRNGRRSGDDASNGEMSTNFWSLDTAFPEPTDFDGINNPFLTDYELEELKTQRQHFMEQLEHLSQTMGNYACRESGHAESPAHTPPVSVTAPVLKNIKGFKGELAKILKTNGYSQGSPVKPKDTQHLSVKVTPEKLFCNTYSPRRKSSTSSPGSFGSFDKSHHGTPETPSAINGLKFSPQMTSKLLNKNGLKQSHPKLRNGPNSKVEKKRLKAVSRCLKNLTPTCGFVFPVLGENHPSVVNGGGPEEGISLNDVSQSSRRGLKRKHPNHNGNRSSPRSSSKQLCNSEEPEPENSPLNSENIRRSFRSRQTVKRFEVNDEARSKNTSNLDGHLRSSVLSTATYNVVSLRLNHDNTVEYLIDWIE